MTKFHMLFVAAVVVFPTSSCISKNEAQDKSAYEAQVKALANSPRRVISGEKITFLELTFSEKKNGDSAVFVLKGVEISRRPANNGSAAREIRERADESSYVVETYDKDKVLIDRYGIRSSRVMFVDNFHPDGTITGGARELPDGENGVLVPYEDPATVRYVQVISNEGKLLSKPLMEVAVKETNLSR